LKKKKIVSNDIPKEEIETKKEKNKSKIRQEIKVKVEESN